MDQVVWDRKEKFFGGKVVMKYLCLQLPRNYAYCSNRIKHCINNCKGKCHDLNISSRPGCKVTGGLNLQYSRCGKFM